MKILKVKKNKYLICYTQCPIVVAKNPTLSQCYMSNMYTHLEMFILLESYNL